VEDGMQTPKEKKLDRLAPGILRDSVVDSLGFGYGEKVYDQPPEICSRCGSKDFMPNYLDKRTFAKVITSSGFEDVFVYLRYHKCKNCGHNNPPANAPFYPNCLYGAPIVDLCLYLLSGNPFNRVERILQSYGIQVDRDTVKRYGKRFKERAMKGAGIKIFGKDMGINVLHILFGVKSVKELKQRYEVDKSDGVADETYPAKKGAKKKMREGNWEWKRNGEKPTHRPDSFCLGLSYLPSLEIFASMLCIESDFNYLLAKILLSPLTGVDLLLTDSDPSYNFTEHERCLFHRLRNLCKQDLKLKEMIKDLAPLEEISRYLHERYKELVEKALESLKRKYPQFVDEMGNFTGALTTNAMEGGNGRIKYELRVPYENPDSVYSRALLTLISDSLYNFRNGMSSTGFGYEMSTFEYRAIMGREPIIPDGLPVPIELPAI
jgi:hypothetical protein